MKLCLRKDAEVHCTRLCNKFKGSSVLLLAHGVHHHLQVGGGALELEGNNVASQDHSRISLVLPGSH